MQSPARCKIVSLCGLGRKLLPVRAATMPCTPLELEGHHSGACVFEFVCLLRPRQETRWRGILSCPFLDEHQESFVAMNGVYVISQQSGSDSGEAVVGLCPSSNAPSEQAYVATACVRVEAKSCLHRLDSFFLARLCLGRLGAGWKVLVRCSSVLEGQTSRTEEQRTCLYGIYVYISLHVCGAVTQRLGYASCCTGAASFSVCSFSVPYGKDILARALYDIRTV